MKGNHDMWLFGYFEEELGVKVLEQPYIITNQATKIYVAHGDGLGPKQYFYKTLRKIFRNKFFQFLFSVLPPYVGISLASYFSASSRKNTGDGDNVFLGEDNEFLIVHSKELLKNSHYDYFVYGHRHLPMELDLTSASKYINLGDWLGSRGSYAVLHKGKVELREWE